MSNPSRSRTAPTRPRRTRAIAAATLSGALSIFWWIQVAREGEVTAWVPAIGFTVVAAIEAATLVHHARRRRADSTPPPATGP